MKHTPGPWRIIDRGSYGCDVVLSESCTIRGAELCGDYDILGVSDAALIAAAPDLLAACKSVMEFLSNGTPVRPGALVQAEVFNAIQKAEGK